MQGIIEDINEQIENTDIDVIDGIDGDTHGDIHGDIHQEKRAPRKRPSRKLLMMIFAAAVLIFGAIAGVRYYNYAAARESTDDAFIEGHIIQISPKVTGYISKLYIKDNQEVKKGDLIAEIDSRDFEVKLDQARAALEAATARRKTAEINVDLTRVTTNANLEQASSSVQLAKSGVQTAEAQAAASRNRLVQARAQVAGASASADQAVAEIKAAEAESVRAQADAERYRQLYGRDEVSRQQLDRATASADSANAQLEAVRKKADAAKARIEDARAAEQASGESLKQAESQISEAHAKVGEAAGRLSQAGAAPQQIAVSKMQVETASAEIERLKAEVDKAELDLSYTKIYAPESGRAARKAIEEGSYVQAGQAMLAIVANDVWVTANFKETQLSHMKIGQPVEIKIDTYSDKFFKGHVDSFQYGTGARFSLLPPENAAGNYVKVVQRVPVKIVFDEQPDEAHLLAPGMSVVPQVKVK